ncbi:hypothetical protein M8J75_010316 [Diaphorina citri]|nr:hypothetical protein M8J75_010316 [Diaphorina citri]
MERKQPKEATKINQTQEHSSINISQMNLLEALAKVATSIQSPDHPHSSNISQMNLLEAFAKVATKASRVQTIHTAATLAK